jgi:dipeptidyl aminopeptidase/acylaminoacyl peptidase
MRLGFLLAGVLMAAGSAEAASAAYPGENGRIYFHSCGNPCGRFDIYSVNPDGSDPRNLTEALTAPVGLPDNAFDPSVSGDGKRVVFGVDTQASAEIWIINADGSGAVGLTKDNLLDQEPSISPDGTRVAWNQFSPFPGYTDRDIWVMGSDGSSQQTLFNGGGEDYYPEFTPDGQTVVMASETGDMDIRKVPSIPTVPPLTTAIGVAEDNELLESQPSVSPDGNRVAFTQTAKSSPFGPYDIYSVGINGGATTPVVNTAASETSPAYSPDGTKMVFSSDGVPMIGNANGSGTPVPLDVGNLESVGRFDWAPKVAAPPAEGPPANAGLPPSGGSATATLVGPPPSGRIGKHPKKQSTNRRARFTFFSDQAGSHFECKLDRRPFRPCASPFVRNVKLGHHDFRLRAINAAGAPDSTPATFSWRVVSR